MELIIIVALAVAVIAWFIWRDRKYEQSGSHPLDGATKVPEPWPFPTSRPPEGDAAPVLTQQLDINNDGKVDVKDAVSVLDVNKDGRVDLKDVVAAADVVVKEAKKVAKKAKAKTVEVVEKVKKPSKKK